MGSRFLVLTSGETGDPSTALLSIERQHLPEVLYCDRIIINKHLKTSVQKVNKLLGHVLLPMDVRFAVLGNQPDGPEGGNSKHAKIKT